MKLWKAALLLAFACYIPCGAEDESEGRLLISKNILNLYLVESKDLTVEYRIYNVGSSSALDVQLNDDSFPEADFEVLRGNLKATWDRIAPNSNVTHAVILRPVKSGYFNFTSAEVSYMATEGASDRQFGYSSSPGEGAIVPSKEFDRRFSPHVLDWLVFAIMTLPSLGIPFLLWYGSKSRYDTPRSKKGN